LAVAFNRLVVTASSHTQNSKYPIQVLFYGAVEKVIEPEQPNLQPDALPPKRAKKQIHATD